MSAWKKNEWTIFVVVLMISIYEKSHIFQFPRICGEIDTDIVFIELSTMNGGATSPTLQ